MKVKNFSRHPFNTDQRRTLEDFGYDPEDGARKPFFKDAEDFVAQVGGEIVSAVVPSAILLEAMAAALIPAGTVLVVWEADQDARSRERFAVRGMKIYRWGWSSDVPTKINDTGVSPTVENDFKTGEEFAYGGGGK